MKKILAFLLASILLLSLCACSGGKDDNSSEVLISVGKTEEVEVKAAENVFPENTVVEIKPVTSGESYAAADTALKETAEKFTVYDITAKSENVTVQPNGTVKATFDVPTEYDLDKVGVVYISDDGKVEALSCTVDKETKTVTAQLSHFSLYAVIEKVEAEVESTVASDESSSADNSKVASNDSSSKAEEPSKPANTSKPTETSKPANSTKPTESSKPTNSTKPTESSKPAHTHSFANATCTEAKKCACGATEGKALGHDYIDDKCSRCGAVDATYKALTSGQWLINAVSGNKLYAMSFIFGGDEPFASIGEGDNIKTLPEDFQKELIENATNPDYADSIVKVGNETYYIGMGGGNGFTFTVDKNTVVLTEIDTTKTLTITRVAGDKYKISAINGDFLDTNGGLKVGDVLVWEKAEAAEA